MPCKKSIEKVEAAAYRIPTDKPESDGTLSVVHINDPGAGKFHMLRDMLPRIKEEDIVDQFQEYGYGEEVGKIDIILIDSEDYAKEIARATADFDLLIMGHHPKSRILAVLKDSTDERVADRIHCPIMLVPLGGA